MEAVGYTWQFNDLLAEINYPMKADERKQSTISDIRLIFYPKSITFNHAKDTSYRLFLEKSTYTAIQMSRSSMRSQKS